MLVADTFIPFGYPLRMKARHLLIFAALTVDNISLFAMLWVVELDWTFVNPLPVSALRFLCQYLRRIGMHATHLPTEWAKFSHWYLSSEKIFLHSHTYIDNYFNRMAQMHKL